MNSVVQQIVLKNSIITLSLSILLAACGPIGLSSQPPLPTIVPVTDTPTTQPSATVDVNVLDSQAVSEEAIKQEDTSPEVPTRISTNPLEPTSIPTLAASPTEVPPTVTPSLPFLPTATALPSPTPTLTVEPMPSLDSVKLKLIPIASGFNNPVFLTHAGDGSGRLFVVEQTGRIMILENGNINPAPFLDIVSIVGSDANEQGLLSVAFHPDYVNNGFFFVNYTNQQGDTVIARYSRSDDPGVANPDKGKLLMTIDQPYANHNGGQIAFGPDGYLYIGMGDGGAANDPQNRAQDMSNLLGKLLRIDVDNADPYGAPQNNPFVNTDQARAEIWSYGWRNPWRFSFDVATGDMYVADVGQNQYEEVHVEWAGDAPGQNYGWRLMEGFHCFNPGECDPTELELVLPVAEYDHNFGCSITGGYVYRGSQFPALAGIYFYGDYCSGIVWGMQHQSDGSWAKTEMLQSDKRISSFGQDKIGEVYLVDRAGDIFQLGN